MITIETLVLIGILMLLTIANLKLAIDYLDSKESKSKKGKKDVWFFNPQQSCFSYYAGHCTLSRHQEEKETLGTAVEITLTHRQVQRHLETILERIASEKLTKVIITNSKEAPQGVLLSYGKYRALLAFKELHEYNAEEKIKEKNLWEEQASKLSQDSEYQENLHELG